MDTLTLESQVKALEVELTKLQEADLMDDAYWDLEDEFFRLRKLLEESKPKESEKVNPSLIKDGEIHKMFGETKVSIYLSGVGELNFYINGKFPIDKEIKNKVAITKWLLTEIKLLQTQANILFCKPYECDGNLEYRQRAFTKLGFIINPEYPQIMEWFR